MQRAVFETETKGQSTDPYGYKVGYVRTNEIGTPNWHERLELLWGIIGETVVCLNGRNYRLRPGDAVIANSEVIHSVSSGGGNAAFGILYIRSSFFEQNDIGLSRLAFREYICNDEELNRLMGAFEAVWQAPREQPLKRARAGKILLELLIYLYDHYRDEAGTVNTDAAFRRVRETMRYIRVHLASPLSLDEIAGHVNINKYQLEKEFKSVAGIRVFEFINTVRCAEARRMISEGAFVGEAALQCGFHNLSYFSGTYKRIIGELPKETKQRG